MFGMIDLSDQKFTDADIPAMKATFAGMLKQGMPLILHKAIADAAVKKGFEEGVHFIRQQQMPSAACPHCPGTIYGHRKASICNGGCFNDRKK